MSGFLDGGDGIDHAVHHVPIRFFMGFVAEHAARKTESGLHFLHFGIEQGTLAQQGAIGVNRDASLLALTGNFHCFTLFVQFTTLRVLGAKLDTPILTPNYTHYATAYRLTSSSTPRVEPALPASATSG
jgi:hypothetical protein